MLMTDAARAPRYLLRARLTRLPAPVAVEREVAMPRQDTAAFYLTGNTIRAVRVEDWLDEVAATY